MVTRLACALPAEMWAARKVGLPPVLVGMACRRGPPSGPIISFGVAGSLRSGLPIGTIVVANRIVDARGKTLWEGIPLKVCGAISGVVHSAPHIYDLAEDRNRLHRESGALICEMESWALANPLFQGCVRVVSDTPEYPLGAIAKCVRPDGSKDILAILTALKNPRVHTRAIYNALLALRTLSRVEFEL